MDPKNSSKNSRPLGLFLIGLFKLGKGLLVLALGIGVLKTDNKDIDMLFLELITRLHIDAEHRFIQKVLAHLSLIDNHTSKPSPPLALFSRPCYCWKDLALFFKSSGPNI